MLMAALRDTLRTLRKPYFFRMLWLSMIVTAAILALFAIACGVLLFTTRLVDNPFAEWSLDLAFLFASFFVAWLGLPILMPLIAIIFLENIAVRIGREEFGEEEVRPLPFGGEVAHALKFFIVTLGLNILFLPLYLIFFFVAPFIYFSLNSYLIGREFFELAAAIHIGRDKAWQLRKRYGGTVLMAGACIMGMTAVPILNLFAPFMGAALMVHLFRRAAKREGLMRQTVLPPEVLA